MGRKTYINYKFSEDDRCSIGKSCGAACIERRKYCLIGLIGNIGSSLKSLTNKLTEDQKVPSSVVPASPPKTTLQPSSPNPSPSPKVEEKSKLSPLSNWSEFVSKKNETDSISSNPKLNKDSLEVAKLLERKSLSLEQELAPKSGKLYDTPEEKSKYDALRSNIGNFLISNGLFALAAYTGDEKMCTRIRDAQANPKGSPFGDVKMAKDLDDLLSLKEIPKPEVEKFRGFRSSVERLREMVNGANNQERFNHNTTQSWSSSLKISQDFADKPLDSSPDRTERVVFRTINKRGVPIEYVSQISGEDEILTQKDTNYRYLSHREVKSPDGITYHVFDVEELP